ncbi:hypothetical protein CCAX7_19020 [Capsulimonas corticalis]|uniref:Uncharacterized protein n=1 Tax=Capsulimonas corticalis TaxID=2219043 RepID=A0A9N7L1R5_9BACT|nr:hypothetical protein CCAX7_19020 [Capsulimonas corticalis]
MKMAAKRLIPRHIARKPPNEGGGPFESGVARGYGGALLLMIFSTALVARAPDGSRLNSWR